MPIPFQTTEELQVNLRGYRESLRMLQTQSACVVMPERKQLPDLMFAEFHESRGWNACLDEFARLNGKEVGRG